MKALVVDVGGTNVKILGAGMPDDQMVKIPSGPTMDAAAMAESVLAAASGWEYDAISIGYPGPVQHGKIVQEPHNLAPGWVDFDFEARFGKPVKIINDAAMQALGSYEGGHMLFLGLGTGLGSALVVQGVVAPLEVAHLPYRKGRTFEDYVGLRGLERLGPKKWKRHVARVVAILKAALVADYVVLGGGNSKRFQELPEGCRRGDNDNAFVGGQRLWQSAAEVAYVAPAGTPTPDLPPGPERRARKRPPKEAPES